MRYFSFTVGPLIFSEFTKKSSFFFLLPPFLLPLSTGAAPPAAQGRPRPPPALRGTHASRPSPSPLFCPRAGALLPVPRAPMAPPAATSPPPWTARDRAPPLSLSRASAP